MDRTGSDEVTPGSPYWPPGTLDELNRQIQDYELQLAHTPPCSPDLLRILSDLAIRLVSRFKFDKKKYRADIDRALQYLEYVAHEAGARGRALTLWNLGLALRERYLISPKNITHLRQAIRYQEEALKLTDDLSLRLDLHYHLSETLHDYYEETADKAALQSSVINAKETVNEGKGSSNYAHYLTNLANLLGEQYARLHKPSDLDDSDRYYEQAVQHAPPDSPIRASVLDEKGRGLVDRYFRTGRVADLEQAVKALEEAVSLSRQVCPNEYPLYLTNLASGLRTKYRAIRDISALQKAIESYKELLDDYPTDPRIAMYYGNMGAAFTDLYHSLEQKEPTYIEEAIHHCQNAVNLGLSAGHPDLPLFRTNLGNALSDRYRANPNSADAQAAIRNFELAISETPRNSWEWQLRNNDLGGILMYFYEKERSVVALERAVRCFRESINASEPNAPLLPMYLTNLGDALKKLYEHSPTDSVDHLKNSIEAWERAISVLQAEFPGFPVPYQIGQELSWSSVFEKLVGAYLELAEASPLESSSARCRAFVLAETSKARILTQLLGIFDIPAPPEIPPDQVARERILRRELFDQDISELATHALEGEPEKQMSQFQRLVRRSELIEELKGLWRSMAQCGTEAAVYVALRRGDPPSWHELASWSKTVGQNAAMLSLFMTDRATVMFILRAGWESPIVLTSDLDKAGWARIWQRLVLDVHRHDHRRDVWWRCALRRTWTILRADSLSQVWSFPLCIMAERVRGYLVGVERVLLSPYSLGHLIPWSVIGQQAGWCASDGGTLPITIVPVLTVSARLWGGVPQTNKTALVVNPKWGNPKLDLVYAEEEAISVAKVLGTEALIGPEATKNAVLQKMSTAAVIHIATHARFNPSSPLDSIIKLADGDLTTREVLQIRLQADLLVLSACETGMAETLGGDDFVGFAQAFLLAGARSVIVSLWRVNDPATASLMTSFYRCRAAGTDNARALSLAVKSIAKRLCWNHAYYWGPFILIGKR